MRLKKHTSAAVLHSQLSAILEKLMLSAVEEIKELVFDFCEEISQDKAQDWGLCEETAREQEESLFDPSATFSRDAQEASSESYEEIPASSSREDAKEKQDEQNYVKFPITIEFPSSAQVAMSPNCKFEQTAATSCEKLDTNSQREECSQDRSRQSSSEPPEDSKDLVTDYNSLEETQSAPYEDLSSNQGNAAAAFHIKQEEDTAAFETGNYTGLQMQTGHRETGVPSFGQETSLIHSGSWSPSFRVAPVPVRIQGSMFTNSLVAQRNQIRDNTWALPPPKKVLFKCEFCSKTYPFPSLLKAHYLKHTKGKQLVCGYCGKLFKWEYSLRRHEKMHLNEWKH